MTQIDVGYHKKFLREKMKLARKCTSIEGDFENFKKALMVDIKYNNYTVPTGNDKYFRIAGWITVYHYLLLLPKHFIVKK